MAAQYRIARSAKHDLQEISDYWISEADKEVASRIINSIIETVITISSHPQAGVAAERFGEQVRKFAAGRYMIYYRPYAKGIEVLHVFHGARHQTRAWRKSRT